MIIDKISNLKRYEGVLPSMSVVEKVFNETNWLEIQEGQYKTDNPCVRYNVFSYDTVSYASEKAEFHDKEIDIQFIISGSEKMELSALMNDDIVVPYDESKDAGFVKNERNVVYYAGTNTFAIFFPYEPHAPSLKIFDREKVKKVVFKVKV